MRSELRHLAVQTIGFRKPIAAGVVLILIGTLVSLAYPPLIGKVIDLAIGGDSQSRNMVGLLCAALAVVLMLRSALSFCGGYLLDTTGTRLVNRLRERLFAQIIDRDYGFFISQRVGDLISRIQVDAQTIRDAVTHTVATLLNQCFMFFGALTVMLIMDWQLTLLILFLAPFSAWISHYFGRRIAQSSRAAHDHSGNSGAIAAEALNGIHTVKSFKLEPVLAKRFSAAVRNSLDRAIQTIRLRAVFSAIVTFSTSLVTLGIFWYGGLKVLDGQMSGGQLITFLFYSENITQSFSVVSSLYSQIAQAIGSSSRVFELMDQGATTATPLPPCPPGNEQQMLVAHNVGFNYPDGATALAGISFSMRGGQILGLIGPSGCGKTTLSNLICGLYPPTSGMLMMGLQPASSQADQGQITVAVVPQETFIFDGSIAENIAMVAPHSTELQVQHAAGLACVTDFSDSLPEQLHTRIGERGARLSGGQRQRIGLARALLLQPALLILDEATSALDVATEARVMQQILDSARRQQTSVILITHRLSLLRYVDQILQMDNGQIVWRGDYADYNLRYDAKAPDQSAVLQHS